MISRRTTLGLVALLGALLALLWARCQPTYDFCQSKASLVEEECRGSPLVIHISEEDHDTCRAIYDATLAECVRP